MNILVAAHQRKIRQALRLLFEEEFAANVSEAETIEQVEENLRDSKYQLLVLAWGMVEADALHRMQQLRAVAPEAAFVVLVRSHAETKSAKIAGAEHAFDRTLPPAKLTALIKEIVAPSGEQGRRSGMPKDHWVLTDKHLNKHLKKRKGS